MGITPEITNAQKSFLAALKRLISYADAGYGVGITWDGHTGVLVDIGSDCSVLVGEGADVGLSKSDAWLALTTKGITEVIEKKTAMNKGGS